MQQRTEHLCNQAGIGDMRGLYSSLGVIPTSTHGDTILIRSHIAYHCGITMANRADIRPSRGHSYRVKFPSFDGIVRITDYYDHRKGVTGIVPPLTRI